MAAAKGDIEFCLAFDLLCNPVWGVSTVSAFHCAPCNKVTACIYVMLAIGWQPPSTYVPQVVLRCFACIMLHSSLQEKQQQLRSLIPLCLIDKQDGMVSTGWLARRDVVAWCPLSCVVSCNTNMFSFT